MDQPDRAAQSARLPIARIVAPRSIAVIGASEDLGKFGGRILHYLQRFGFPGLILPVNPNRARLRGLPAYPSVEALPEPPDVAILAVPAAGLLAQIEACARAGVGAAIVITGKLAEAGPEGAAIEAACTAAARAAGMRLLGPNCLGILNLPDRAMMSSSLALEGGEIRVGGIGMVSQSGALMGTLVSLGADAGAGFSRCISVGNQADLCLEDFLDYLIEDPATRVIALYIEGLRDGPRFLGGLRRARAAGKPVLCVKAGRSEAGAQAARSHTASLAGSYAVFAAACRDAGAVVMDDPAQMLMAADALDRLPRLPRAGMGVAVMASSGGSTVTTADLLPRHGLRLGQMAPATRATLARFLPESHIHLPVDTGSFHDGAGEEAITACIRALLSDPDIGALIYPMTTQPAMAERAAMLPPLCREMGRPILFVMMAGRVGDGARAAFHAAGLPCFDRVGDALAVARALVEEAAGRARADLPPPERPAGAGPAPEGLPRGALTEAEAKRLVAAYGVPVVRGLPAASEAEAIAAAADLGFPVVLKGVSRAILHKSDLRLVRLGLPDAQAVARAFHEVTAILAVHAPGGGEGVLVQEMAAGEAELILGARWDPILGPVVLAGAGGVLVELLSDVALAPAPLRPADARALLEGLAMAPLLRGLRGRPALDVAAAAEALVRLSWLAADLGPRLVELDLNPVLLRPAGQGVIAVDARAILG
ncbi:MAG: acetate--CoA ligase family protein [Rhodovarius sp.]|nr:acetate--CoA ligase family protein [Rhodovarius sp.]MDW8315776.1 acetate--CoA ligase family protein [Rhodovarius sp.]